MQHINGAVVLAAFVIVVVITLRASSLRYRMGAAAAVPKPMRTCGAPQGVRQAFNIGADTAIFYPNTGGCCAFFADGTSQMLTRFRNFDIRQPVKDRTLDDEEISTKGGVSL